uniref:response regulator n=1 Tax=Bacteroides sp. TaxID=29523 RepID=UPI002632FCD5
SKKSVRYPVYGQSGTGIGLFLCKRIVNLHGGTIYARNNHGQGASFRILMPLLPCDGVEETIAETSEPIEHNNTPALQSTEEPQKKEAILIVEDNKDMRSYIRMLLAADYRLFEAGDGEEALEIVQKQSVDLIVSDLMMPVMDGMELSRRIKENLATSHIPFLMLTALRSDVQEKRSFEIGVDEYLCKPFDEEVLKLRIRNILNLRNKYKKMFSSSSKVEELHVREESRDKTFITNAVNLMTQHYADSEYNLECFVRDMGYSKTLVNKKMQDLTGQPIGQFMKNYRLNVAQRMIQEGPGDINVSEVAYAVGFNDPKYFTKCFKEFFGYLPSSKISKAGKQ